MELNIINVLMQQLMLKDWFIGFKYPYFRDALQFFCACSATKEKSSMGYQPNPVTKRSNSRIVNNKQMSLFPFREDI